MKIPGRSVDKVRVGARARKRERKKEERTRTGDETGVTGRRGQDRSGSKGLGRAESVGGIPLAPRDDNHLVSRARILRAKAYDPTRRSRAALYYASARLDLFPPSQPEIILKIPSRICRYFVTRLAHVGANDLIPPVPKLPDVERISGRPESVNR